MTAQVIKINRSATAKIECSSCGAFAEAGCDCGAPYVPAGCRASAAVAASPQKSDRAIAAELGIGNATVSRARRKSTVSGETVGARIGKDGKVRRLPKKPIDKASDPIQESCPDCDTAEQHWQRSLGNLASDAVSMRDFWSRQFGNWKQFAVSSDLITLANQAADAWNSLAKELKKRT